MIWLAVALDVWVFAVALYWTRFWRWIDRPFYAVNLWRWPQEDVDAYIRVSLLYDSLDSPFASFQSAFISRSHDGIVIGWKARQLSDQEKSSGA